MMKNITEVPKIVKEAAKRHGLLNMEYIGHVGDAQVFTEVNPADVNGVVAPTGLPCLILLEKDETKLVDGLDALDILDAIEK